jgi:hypothetical protein
VVLAVVELGYFQVQTELGERKHLIKVMRVVQGILIHLETPELPLAVVELEQ